LPLKTSSQTSRSMILWKFHPHPNSRPNLQERYVVTCKRRELLISYPLQVLVACCCGTFRNSCRLRASSASTPTYTSFWRMTATSSVRSRLVIVRSNAITYYDCGLFGIAVVLHLATTTGVPVHQTVFQRTDITMLRKQLYMHLLSHQTW